MNKNIILNIFPNFDNYVRNYFKKTNIKNYTYINTEIENFKIYLKKILNYKKNISNISNICLINSWNEWGENMAIEPSNEYGFNYLEIIYEEIKNYAIN